MVETLLVTLPFFLVVGLGYAAGRWRLFDDTGVGVLNRFVFYFAMPALVIRVIGQQELDRILDPTFLIVWASAGLIMFGLGVLLTVLVFRGGLGECAVVGQAISIGNLGFLALPLMLAVFGNQAAGPVATAILIDLIILIPLSIALLEISGSGKQNVRWQETAKNTAKGVVFNPFVLAILAGFLLSASGIPLVGPVDRFFEFFGAAAGPTALFALGISLADRRVEGDRLAIVIMSLAKLIIHPLLVFSLFSAFGVTGIERTMATVVAAMPIAGNVFVIARGYGVLVRRASASILVSTVFATITVAVALKLFDV